MPGTKDRNDKRDRLTETGPNGRRLAGIVRNPVSDAVSPYTRQSRSARLGWSARHKRNHSRKTRVHAPKEALRKNRPIGRVVAVVVAVARAAASLG